MGKKLTKSEKLDLVLSELAKLRAEVKKFVVDRGVVADQRIKAAARSAGERPKKLPKRTGAEKKLVKDMGPSQPVLVQAPQAPQPTGRTASQ